VDDAAVLQQLEDAQAAAGARDQIPGGARHRGADVDDGANAGDQMVGRGAVAVPELGVAVGVDVAEHFLGLGSVQAGAQPQRARAAEERRVASERADDRADLLVQRLGEFVFGLGAPVEARLVAAAAAGDELCGVSVGDRVGAAVAADAARVIAQYPAPPVPLMSVVATRSKSSLLASPEFVVPSEAACSAAKAIELASSASAALAAVTAASEAVRLPAWTSA
jgi:hypothetical protein